VSRLDRWGADPLPRPAGSTGPLPALLVVTDAASTGGRDLLDVVAAAVEGGARAVLLRDKQLPRPQRARLARQLADLLTPLGGVLLISAVPAVAPGALHGEPRTAPSDPGPGRGTPRGVTGGAVPAPDPDPDPGVRLGAADSACIGVHLGAADAFPVARPRLVGRSCHGRAEVAAAAAEGCDYALLSPIFPTASKPGYGPALGTGALADHPLPVWALGGIEPGNAASCLAAGAAGVAVMGALMRAEDPAVTAAAFCAALVARSTRRGAVQR